MLLLYASQPLTSIASSLGFHSLSHFSKAFKAAEGIPPLRFPPAGFPTRKHLGNFTETVF